MKNFLLAVLIGVFVVFGSTSVDALAQSLVDDPSTDDVSISLDGFSIADQVEVFERAEGSTDIPVNCQCSVAEDECTQLLKNCVETANQEHDNGNYSDALYTLFILVYCPEAWSNCVSG